MIAPPVPNAQVTSIVQRSDAIMKGANGQAIPSWLRVPKKTAAEAEVTVPKPDEQANNVLQQYARQYAPQTSSAAQQWLRTRVNGVPVVPPNLHGKALQEYVDHTLMKKEENAAKTLVFISMDMPHALLRRWFAEVADNKHLFETTVFVLRGWADNPEGLPDLVGEINHLMPSARKSANVEINPILFTDHHVNIVPVIIHKPKNRLWGAVVGDGFGLRKALFEIDSGKGSPTKIHGHTWKIVEPNMISVFEKKIKHFNWKKTVANARQRSWAEASSRLIDPLPDSIHGKSYTYNPSIIATATIRLPDGKVLVRKGQELNPLTAFPFPWTQSYIVFNPAQSWQVAQVQAWESTYPNVVLMASELPKTWQEENALVNRLQHPVYGFYPALATRLGIDRVPALIRPDHDVLAITVPKEPLPGEKQ